MRHGSQYLLNLGPHHPALPGPMRLALRMEGERCQEALCHVGYQHRGLEKALEWLDWDACLHLLEHLDHHHSLAAPFALALALEELLELALPARIAHLRTIALELDRVRSLLAAVGRLVQVLDATPAYHHARPDLRELGGLLAALRPGGAVAASGTVRVGGLALDPPRSWLQEVSRFSGALEERVQRSHALLDGHEVFRLRTAGLAVCTPAMARAHGVTGPIRRASGEPMDLRRRRPYLAYEALGFEVPGALESPAPGDCQARYRQWVAEILGSLRLLRRACEDPPAGAAGGEVGPSRELTIPPGEHTAWVEGPRGELGITVVATGAPRPFRVRVRPPSCASISLLPVLLVGAALEEIPLVLASLDLSPGEVDR